tara:strand:+ start:39 stop:431 length:393 start_codon:yes stop_codon:yes gene_type:complete
MSWRDVIKNSTTDRLFDELIQILREYNPWLLGVGDRDSEGRADTLTIINRVRGIINDDIHNPAGAPSAFRYMLSVIKKHHKELVERTGQNMHSARNVDFIATLEDIIEQIISAVAINTNDDAWKKWDEGI